MQNLIFSSVYFVIFASIEFYLSLSISISFLYLEQHTDNQASINIQSNLEVQLRLKKPPYPKHIKINRVRVSL